MCGGKALAITGGKNTEKGASQMKLILGFAVLAIAVSAQAKTIEVKMLNTGKDGTMVFEPGFSQAAVGDTLKFNPVDKSHNSSSALVPAGAKAWVGKPDEAVTVKLEKEGVYIFKCDPHSIMAMVGVVQVGKAINLTDANALAAKLAPTFVMNKDRLTKQLANVK
jgi:pseudoazurin